MEPAKADDGVNRESLEKALADSTVEQLKEMARRLTQSVEGMKEMLTDAEAEGKSLREDTEYLNSTITLMMQEMHKLNIGAGNTVEPQLAEGPLDFVGRFWEKVKPRDTAYQTSEHVGEIKKPVPGEAPTPNVQQVAREAGQQVVQKAQKIQSALGPLWQRTQGFLDEKQKELAGKVAAHAKQRSRGAASGGYAGRSDQDGKRQQAGPYPDGSAASAGAAASSAAASSAAPAAGAEGDAAREAADPASGASGAAEAAAEVAAQAAEPAPAPSTSTSNAEAAAAPGPAPAGQDGGPAAGGAGGEEPITSTILIEAKLKVDGGSVLTLRVRASDRSKEVAQRFVQENSLKAWFQDPLTAWLKKVEDDAEKFPVQIEADLMEIRKQFSKSK